MAEEASLYGWVAGTLRLMQGPGGRLSPRQCKQKRWVVAEVQVHEGESIDNALRRFKRKVMTEQIITEVKRRSAYLKPGEKRRLKQALARKRARKKNSKRLGSTFHG